jgi:hypothetical protein
MTIMFEFYFIFPRMWRSIGSICYIIGDNPFSFFSSFGVDVSAVLQIFILFELTSGWYPSLLDHIVHRAKLIYSTLATVHLVPLLKNQHLAI